MENIPAVESQMGMCTIGRKIGTLCNFFYSKSVFNFQLRYLMELKQEPCQQISIVAYFTIMVCIINKC